MEKLGHRKGKNALASVQRQALDELCSMNDIVIKQADKGGAVVLMNVSDYVSEAYRQLSDISIYALLDSDPTCHLQKRIEELTRRAYADHFINKQERGFLNTSAPRLA